LILSQLEKIKKHGDNHLYSTADIKGAAAVVYIAGADTVRADPLKKKNIYLSFKILRPFLP